MRVDEHAMLRSPSGMREESDGAQRVPEIPLVNRMELPSLQEESKGSAPVLRCGRRQGSFKTRPIQVTGPHQVNCQGNGCHTASGRAGSLVPWKPAAQARSAPREQRGPFATGTPLTCQ